MLTDDGRTTDGRTTDTFIYYKLTNEPSAQVSYKRKHEEHRTHVRGVKCLIKCTNFTVGTLN